MSPFFKESVFHTFVYQSFVFFNMVSETMIYIGPQEAIPPMDYFIFQ